MNLEAEQLLRLEQLRRRINADARRSVMQLVGALVAAFLLGYLAGRYGR
jgi:hypothetical protein